jgi:hypothetical protein
MSAAQLSHRQSFVWICFRHTDFLFPIDVCFCIRYCIVHIVCCFLLTMLLIVLLLLRRMQLAVNAQWPKELGGLGAQVLYIGGCRTPRCLPHCETVALQMVALQSLLHPMLLLCE